MTCTESVKNNHSSFVWSFDNLDRIGGFKTTILGSPKVIEAPNGKAVEFEGMKDGLFLETHPLSGLQEFTIEIIFRPDSGGLPEQRFFHMQSDTSNRVLVETRLVGDSWFLDTYIKSGESDKTLYSENFQHPLDQWYHLALTYKNNVMTHYVNGVKELSGEVKYIPVESGQTSIGCRLNKVYWFKGAIHKIRLCSKALQPNSFMLLSGYLEKL